MGTTGRLNDYRRLIHGESSRSPVVLPLPCGGVLATLHAPGIGNDDGGFPVPQTYAKHWFGVLFSSNRRALFRPS